MHLTNIIKLVLFTVLLLGSRLYLVWRINRDFWFAMSISMNGTSLLIIKYLDFTCGALILMWVIIILLKIIIKSFGYFNDLAKKKN